MMNQPMLLMTLARMVKASTRLPPSPSSSSPPPPPQKTTRFLFQYLKMNLDGLDPHDEPADVADDLGEDGESED